LNSFHLPNTLRRYASESTIRIRGGVGDPVPENQVSKLALDLVGGMSI
jgi:hypothetical protein